MSPETEKHILDAVAGILEEVNKLDVIFDTPVRVSGQGSIADIECASCGATAKGFDLPLREDMRFDIAIWLSLHKCKRR